jgi:hypothetical protein
VLPADTLTRRACPRLQARDDRMSLDPGRRMFSPEIEAMPRS